MTLAKTILFALIVLFAAATLPTLMQPVIHTAQTLNAVSAALEDATRALERAGRR